LKHAIDEAGWFAPATREPSPNFDARPEGVAPSLLVLHNISLPPGQFNGQAVIEFFQNRLDWDAHPFYAQIRNVRVSSHFLIRRNGEVVQFVSCNDRAWHAGLSTFFGRDRCNDFSIGIEIEGSDEQPFDDAQYAPLANLASALIERYALTAVAGHSDIAPGRKTDPGPHFEWPRLRRMLALPAEYFPYLGADQPDAR
jgi:N-acetyl-anhydromuramoyl-L-alanine amidase